MVLLLGILHQRKVRMLEDLHRPPHILINYSRFTFRVKFSYTMVLSYVLCSFSLFFYPLKLKSFFYKFLNLLANGVDRVMCPRPL